ncbi:hypothetical protein CWI37_1768p0010 [Hamiltosporidium tvaerminnensis]|uniref:Uncharacterized protein n=2 Tax=Hamiltosporidium TaxID=1176354 RepID=A0A4Q9L7N3_9MICR|nr:hypothetical protein CWI37_1768p0010 [Hamiltosporidium tvaerminnensis]TBU03658.1 hypothetical protein CWI39_0930p0020 [Hamiltosporidium magnivora]
MDKSISFELITSKKISTDEAQKFIYNFLDDNEEDLNDITKIELEELLKYL